MFDLLIRGDRVVMPHGVGPWEIAVKDDVIVALARAAVSRPPSGPRDRRRRRHRDAGRHRPARALRLVHASLQSGGAVRAQAARRSRSAARHSGAVRRPSSTSPPANPTARATSRRARACATPSRRATGTSPAPATATTPFTSCCSARSGRLRAELAEAVQAGIRRSRCSPPTSRPSRKGRMVDFGEHLGGAEGAGEGRRHRRDPRRGQRHRHAHVRKAVARGPHRLREHGRGAHHAVGGSVVQPGDPARRQCRGRGALHDAHLGGDRRAGDRGGARRRRADLRRDPAPVPAVHGRGL